LRSYLLAADDQVVSALRDDGRLGKAMINERFVGMVFRRQDVVVTDVPRSRLGGPHARFSDQSCR
jgi:hypothetical protein